MQEVAPGPELQEDPPPSASASAPTSWRTVTWLEIASVIVSILITTWAIVPFQLPQKWLASIPGLLALGLIINSHRVRGESRRDLGFTTRHFTAALRLLLWPTLIACATLILIGALNDSFHRTNRFWSTLIYLPFWGTLQQYVLQGFVYRRVRSLLVDESLPPQKIRQQIEMSVIVTSLIFGFVHLPNLTLSLLTFLGGLTWSWVYERAPNLFVLGLSHAMMSFLLMSSSPPWLLDSMSVGYKHFLYQKF
ncbi:MAG TPA: CPBP family intramembrane glutamic endopeptidase [Blastocatellia bacterium]|nr:CPBP family intramembrane glutamic endopeptidase [Blastocatellia bacterium]